MMCVEKERKLTVVPVRLIALLFGIALSAAMLPTSAFALQVGGEGLVAGSISNTQPALVTHASKASKNKAAHKAYLKELKKLVAERNAIGKYRFMDVTGDGVDEMITMWWPAVYTYKGGKVKKVFSGDIGRVLFQKAYKKKKVIVVTLNDPAYTTVSKSYLKWNGSQFVYKATLTPTNSYAKQHGVSSRYYINGKGNVSKKTANAYVKKLVGKAKATKITYKEL